MRDPSVIIALDRQPSSGYFYEVDQKIVASVTHPLSPEVVEMARRAVKDFHECFWWWNPDFVPETTEDVRDIVINLRKGGHRAWQRAKELNACL